MKKYIIIITLIFSFCQQGTQRMKCENQHGMGESAMCLMFLDSRENAVRDGIKRIWDAALLDCLVHNRKLRQCSKKPDYLPAW